MERKELDSNIIIKPCVVCGIMKPLSDFLLSTINMSSISKIKKYSEICSKCRGVSIQTEEQITVEKKYENKIKNNIFNKKTKSKQQIDDDDSSGGGKGKRLTSDNYAKLSVIFKKNMSARVDTSIKGIDQGFRESTKPGAGKR